MKSSKGAVAAGLIVAAVAVTVFCVGVLRKKPDSGETQAVYMETQTTAETTAEALEYVTDANWNAMLKAYKSIAANLGEARRLVDTGLADPTGLVSRAAELVEYGKTCDRDNLLNDEAEKVLKEMQYTADRLTEMIHAGGGETANAAETEATEDSAATAASETDISGETAETDVSEDITSADTQESAEDGGATDAAETSEAETDSAEGTTETGSAVEETTTGTQEASEITGATEATDVDIQPAA